jgi:hypothetical protein
MMIVYQQVQGYQEDMPEMPPDPKTGRDMDDTPVGGVETMVVNIVDRNAHVSHDGDMGRLGKSE